MKYIRTKYGVYEVEKKERAYFEGQPWLYYLKGKYDVVDEKDVLNQSDTIEELCDMLVVKYKNDLPRPQLISELKKSMELVNITWEEHFSWLFKRFKKKLEWVKLAVYTDKGLIYVAKMNGKGKSELL